MYTAEYSDRLILSEDDVLFMLDMMENTSPPTPKLIEAAKEWFGIEELRKT